MFLKAVIPTAQQVQPEDVRDRIAVVIDVLRASSTIVAALAAGAHRIFPVADVEAARIRAAELDALLGGERHSLRVEGFEFGNSPAEYTRDRVEGRTIVLTTTNGTLAVERSAGASEVAICGINNVSAVVRWLRAQNQPTVIVCAGTEGQPSDEDTLCAGLLAHEIGGKGPGLAEARNLLADTPNIAQGLRDAFHGCRLIEKGFGDDVAWCAKRDSADIVPVVGPDGGIARSP